MTSLSALCNVSTAGICLRKTDLVDSSSTLTRKNVRCQVRRGRPNICMSLPESAQNTSSALNSGRNMNLRRRLLLRSLPILVGGSLLGSILSSTPPEAIADELVTASSSSPPAENPLIQRLLERSRANKEKYDKEPITFQYIDEWEHRKRLDDYYKRNFMDYFQFIEGSLQNKSNQSPADKGILEYLKKNRGY